MHVVKACSQDWQIIRQFDEATKWSGRNLQTDMASNKQTNTNTRCSESAETQWKHFVILVNVLSNKPINIEHRNKPTEKIFTHSAAETNLSSCPSFSSRTSLVRDSPVDCSPITMHCGGGETNTHQQPNSSAVLPEVHYIVDSSLASWWHKL